MAQTAPGRHRAPGRFNPINELKTIAKESAQPAVKGAAIVASTGAIVAGVAGPATAAESGTTTVASGAQAFAPAVVGPKASGLNSSDALSSIGFSAPKASTSTTTEAKVIKDLVVEKQREEAAEKAAAEKAAEEAEAAAAAAAEREAETARASRTVERQALPTTTTVQQSATGIVGIAQSMFGVPYVYGGSDPSGFDCSGFTSWVYRQAGISIPRTASQQQAAATRVTTPQAGDLVFFGYPAYHVGIYVSPGQMIDAQRPGTTIGYHSIWTTPSGYGRF